MASYNHLRAYIKSVAPPKDHVLKNCHVVIEGKSFFRDAYKKSGCQSILGGEYDRYAEYLRSILKPFTESNVTCFIIFNGAMDASLEKRSDIQQSVINQANSLTAGSENAYCEPIFIKDIWKEVMDELGITYYVTEHDSTKALLSVAGIFNCPVVTKNYEYSCFVSCIPPNNLTFDKGKKEISCKIFESANWTKILGIRPGLMPFLFTLADENSLYFRRLTKIVDCKMNNLMGSLLRWLPRQWYGLDDNIKRIIKILTEEESNGFLKAYDKNQELCNNKRYMPAVKHFQRNNNEKVIFDDDSNWFRTGVSTGRVAIPYINLAKKGIFSGSWVIFDKEKEDAMLPALDIIFYVCGILTNKQELNITFVGRKGSESSIWEIKKKFDMPISNNSLFKKRHVRMQKKVDKNSNIPDLFRCFVDELVYDFDILKSAPEDCWILIITLAYYWRKNMDKILAHSVILSYIMLGPVSHRVGLIKKCNFMSPDIIDVNKIDEHGLSYQDCITAVNSLMDLFYMKNAKRQFDRSILHSLAEFQHCLQHMNYLNKLCGEKIVSTAYHKTLNGTFVYNTYMKIKLENNPTKLIEKLLKKSSVFDYYQKIVNVFECCLQPRG